MKHKLLLIYSWLIFTLTYFWPDFPFTMKVRGKLYALAMKKSGRNFQVASGAILRTLENITVGDDVYIANYVIINAGGEVIIDSQVLIGFRSCIIAGNHTLKNGSYRFGMSKTRTIQIGFGSWIGCNCSILAGAIVPASTVIGAGSTVARKLGEPGKYIGNKLERL